MKQVVYREWTGVASQSVSLIDADEPRCTETGVVIELRARPINPADLLLIHGRHLAKPAPGGVLGIEGAGVVVEAGARATLSVGARVAIPFRGTWQERMALQGQDVIPLPDDVDLEQAAMFSVNPFSALGLLEGISPGTSVVINAANSALGKLVIALAARRGIHALALVRRSSSIDALRALGAKEVLLESESSAERIRQLAPTPLMRAFDALAGAASAKLFDSLSDGGELIVYGLLASDEVQLPASSLVFRDIRVRGFSRLRFFAALSEEGRQRISEELVAALGVGLLDTAIEARYTLDEVQQAIEHHERAERQGKILLVS